MLGYTIEGLNNLIRKILQKMNEIVSYLRNIDESSEKHYILLENYDQLMIDYSNVVDRKIELYNKIQNNINRP